VDLINADFYRYAHHIVAQTKGALEPSELLPVFMRYKHVDYYEPALFTLTYDWMKARGMTEGASEHESLVLG
jgi:NitT/TauT family transport system substrate-binding protein